MRCDQVREELIDGATARTSAASAHLAGCPSCTGFARRIGQLDDRLRAALVVEPPLELQTRLLALARAAAQPASASLVGTPQPAPTGRLTWLRDLSAWVAALTLVLAGWQLYAWLDASTLVLGNVFEAIQVVAASPTTRLAGDFGVDPLTATLWVTAAVVVWLVAERQRVGQPDAH